MGDTSKVDQAAERRNRINAALARTYNTPESQALLERLTRRHQQERQQEGQQAPARPKARRHGRHRDQGQGHVEPDGELGNQDGLAQVQADAVEAVAVDSADRLAPVADQLATESQHAEPEELPDAIVAAITASLEHLPGPTLSPSPAVTGPGTKPGTKPAERSPGLRLLNVAELDSLPDPRWLVEGILPDGLSVLFGSPGSGKSFLALSWGLHIAAGKPWFGREVETGEPGTVVYIYAEGAAGLKLRVPALMEHAGISQSEVQSFLMFPGAIALGDVKPEELDRLIGSIRSQVQANALPPVRLLVIDTLNRCLKGDENSTEDMSAFGQATDRLRRELTPSVLVVHHCGWDQTRERGSSVLRSSSDIMLSLKKEDEKTQARGRRVAKLTLSCKPKPPRDGEPFEDITLGLLPVDLRDERGNPRLDDEGCPLTSCVVVELESGSKDSPTARLAARTAGLKQRIMAYVTANPGCSKSDVSDHITGKRTSKFEAIGELVRDGVLRVENKGKLDALFIAGPAEGAAVPSARDATPDPLRDGTADQTIDQTTDLLSAEVLAILNDPPGSLVTVPGPALIGPGTVGTDPTQGPEPEELSGTDGN